MVVADGMADTPLAELGGLTPLQYRPQPRMAALAGQGGLFRVRTIPDGFAAGTETAMPLITGYDTSVLTGRGPVEASGMGIVLPAGQFAMRANLVRVAQDGTLTEACPDLSDEEGLAAGRLLAADAALTGELARIGWTFHPQPGFRQMITGPMPPPAGMTPPHNVQGDVIDDHWPADALAPVVRRARALLRERGMALWPWGPGAWPRYEPFADKFGLCGAVISAVPVVRGMALLAGLEAPAVPGATGTLETDWRAKVDAALLAAARVPFVMLHLEAPDDCSHARNVESELKAIAMVDEALTRLCAGAERPYRLLLLPDHVTSTETGRHGAEPVPWCVYDSEQPPGAPTPFVEIDEGPAAAPDVPLRTLLGQL
jgi:2,3-bisphosphoglycerate-independent phosphoglycerate mutase